MTRRVLLALVLAATLPSLAAAKTTLRAVDEGGEANYRFEPARLTVGPGEAIVLQGGTNEPHTLTHDVAQGDRLFHTGNVDVGATGTTTAPGGAGEYAFKCLYHGGMRGTLVVQADAAAPTRDAPLGAPLAPIALAAAALAWRLRRG